MHALKAQDPVGRVFLVSDATLLQLSRVFCRHCERLATLSPAEPHSSLSLHRVMAGELLRALWRDPLAFAAAWCEEIAAGWLPPADSVAAVRKALCDRLAERLLAHPQGTERWFPFFSRPYRPHKKPVPSDTEWITVHRVFDTLAFSELWARERYPSLAPLVRPALGLFAAAGFSLERLPLESGQNEQALGSVLKGVEACWRLASSLNTVEFSNIITVLGSGTWPEAWEHILPLPFSAPEVRSSVESVGLHKTSAKVRALRAVQFLWDYWWREVPGVQMLFAAAWRSLCQIVRWRSHFEESLENAKLEALADFAAGAAHEINNPLAVIGGHAQLLLTDERDTEKRRILATILAQVQRASEMIADTRLFARPPQPVFRPVDFAEILTTLANEFRPIAEEHRVTLTMVPPDENADLSGQADRNQMLIALGALCKNAIEAASPGGFVRLQVEAAPQTIILSVQDNGPGIPAEHRPHIFNPFYSSRQAGRGLGMGLPKAWRIIRQHHGHIQVLCPQEGGTIFKVVLPRQPDSQSQ